MENSSFRKLRRWLIGIGGVLFYVPLAWLCYYDWKIGIPVFFMIVGNNMFYGKGSIV